MARHPRSDNTEPDERFLARWSRRKQQDRGDGSQRAADGDPPAGDGDVRTTPLPVDQEAEPVKGDADMPPLESISESSSVSDFFSPGVSEQLRKMALRKLFQTAKFNIRDGLDDYDDDFRNFAALGDIVTSDMRHQQELAEARAREEQAEIANSSAPESTSGEGPDVQAEQRPAQEEGADTDADADSGVTDSGEAGPGKPASATKRAASAGDDSGQDEAPA